MLGIKGIVQDSNYPQIGGLSGDRVGFPTLGYQANDMGAGTAYQLIDTFSWMKGSHSLKFGFDYRWNGLNWRNNSGPGQFNFGSNVTGLPGFNQTGHGFASMLLGGVGSASVNIDTPVGSQFPMYSWFVQDDWKMSRRLTVNLGVRYEFSSMPLERYGRDASLPNLLDPVPTVGPLYRNPTHLNISPRLGFAYDLTGDGKTALRGGYGIYFNTNNQQHLIVTVTNPPFTPRVAITNPAFPAPDFSTGVGNSMRPIDFNIRSPRIELFNVLLERQLPGDVLVSAGFAGSRGHNLWRSTDWNIAEARPSAGRHTLLAGRTAAEPAVWRD